MVGQNGYSEESRAADFILTFSGEAGGRVLAQIMAYCDPPSREDDFDKPGTLAGKAGMRRVAYQIQRSFMVKAPVTIERMRDPRDAQPVGETT